MIGRRALTGRPPGRSRGDLQDGDTGQLATLDELEGGAPAGREVIEPALQPVPLHGREAVATTDDRERARASDRGGDPAGPAAEWLELEDPHRTVPDDRLG